MQLRPAVVEAQTMSVVTSQIDAALHNCGRTRRRAKDAEQNDSSNGKSYQGE